ncbi:DUF2487 family protein, partial [Bacillus altitudinis]|uniref:DUF2487 family protein n=1 Tax=Bacillus altitudinis TaxID=293387 RepID=UPI0011A4F744
AHLFLQSKHYIHTTIIPLLPIHSTPIKQTLSLPHFTILVPHHLQTQLKPTLFLFPPHTYLQLNHPNQQHILPLKQSFQEHFHHLLFITSHNKS